MSHRVDADDHREDRDDVDIDAVPEDHTLLIDRDRSASIKPTKKERTRIPWKGVFNPVRALIRAL